MTCLTCKHNRVTVPEGPMQETFRVSQCTVANNYNTVASLTHNAFFSSLQVKLGEEGENLTISHGEAEEKKAEPDPIVNM